MSEQNPAGIATDKIMVYAASKEFNDYEVALVGTGLPMIAAYVAKMTRAPNLVLVFESGVVDAQPTHIATGVGDFPLATNAVEIDTLFETLSLLQRGRIDLGFLGGAEIDQYGNINSTAIGPYHTPKTRLPGSGGANDIASLANRVVIVAKHQRRKFPLKVHYVTTPGFLDGPGARDAKGLKGKGPQKVITDLGVFGFDKNTLKMQLLTLHPGATPEMVKERTQFEIESASSPIPETEAPSQDVVDLINELDKDHIYLKE